MSRLARLLGILAVGATASALMASAAASKPSPGKGRGRTAVTIRVAPNPSLATDPTVISGRVKGAPVKPGTAVQLWRMLPKQRRFQPAFATVTDARGRYRLVLPATTLTTNALWYAVVRGVRSPTLHEYVRAAITLVASRPLPLPGERIVLGGHVTPSHRGERVLVERLVGARWKVLGRPSLNRASNFSLAQRFQRAKVRLRVVLAA